MPSLQQEQQQELLQIIPDTKPCTLIPSKAPHIESSDEASRNKQVLQPRKKPDTPGTDSGCSGLSVKALLKIADPLHEPLQLGDHENKDSCKEPAPRVA